MNQIQAVLPDAVGVQQDDGENDESAEGGIQLDERCDGHEPRITAGAVRLFKARLEIAVI
ncbi:MAG TPA: hypothetical protein VGL84_02655 [Gaiellaceae bacterium]